MSQQGGARNLFLEASGDRGRSIIAAAERHGALDIAELTWENQQTYTKIENKGPDSRITPHVNFFQ